MVPTLPDHAERFLRDAGLVRWDEGGSASVHVRPDWSRMMHVVAGLEADTAITARCVQTLGLDRADDIAAFAPVWAAEEAAHARSIRALLAHQVYDQPAPAPPSIARKRRLLAGLPRRAAARLRPTGVVYCTLGAAAEYVTVLVYGELRARVGDPSVAGLLAEITRQERRHHAFFFTAARIRATALSPVEVRVTRRVLASMWQPPGVPSLGVSAWRQAFAPLLDDARLRARVLQMDRIVDAIPHLAGLRLMERFLADRDQTRV
jgi:hypothetical protein